MQVKLLRKTLFMFVALAVILAFSFTAAVAAETDTGGVLGSYDGLIYGDLGDEKAVVIGIDGSNPPSGLLMIPDTVDFDGAAYTVAEIGEGAFAAMAMGKSESANRVSH
ncbi:MAG: hypothetical protein LBK56_13430 [Gracilibacteraceae bacterium]|nr:hypothetical protein [Gracilibacteraceae bacterium]